METVEEINFRVLTSFNTGFSASAHTKCRTWSICARFLGSNTLGNLKIVLHRLKFHGTTTVFVSALIKDLKFIEAYVFHVIMHSQRTSRLSVLDVIA